MSDVTQILMQIESGDPSAAEKLLPLVYDELRRLAKSRMANERSDHTLQSTALVHEAYVRLVDVEHAQQWNNRGHFCSAAAEAMRRILIESAMRKRSQKRGGGRERIDLGDDLAATCSEQSGDLIDFNESLERLALEDAQAAELVKLHFLLMHPKEAEFKRNRLDLVVACCKFFEIVDMRPTSIRKVTFVEAWEVPFLSFLVKVAPWSSIGKLLGRRPMLINGIAQQ